MAYLALAAGAAALAVLAFVAATKVARHRSKQLQTARSALKRHHELARALLGEEDVPLEIIAFFRAFSPLVGQPALALWLVSEMQKRRLRPQNVISDEVRRLHAALRDMGEERATMFRSAIAYGLLSSVCASWFADAITSTFSSLSEAPADKVDGLVADFAKRKKIRPFLPEAPMAHAA